VTTPLSKSPLPVDGLLFALGSAGLYGLNIVYARIAALSGASGPAIVLYRVLLILGVMAAAAVVMRRSLAVPREERVTMGLLGLTTAYVGLCYISSVAFIPVTVAAVIFYTYPTIIVLASPLVEKTRLTLPLLAVVMLALAGVIMVVGPAFDGLDWRGLALAFTAAIACATQFFTAARCHKTNAVAKVFWVHLLVLPVAVLVGAVTNQLAPPSILAAAPFAVFMTIGGYVFGFLFQMTALRRISPVAAGIIYCLEPVVAAFTSVMVLGETLNGMQIAGGVLVLAAIVTNILLQRPRQDPIVPTD
jgi:drug/metabolite transporter (DMT)-like permease